MLFWSLLSSQRSPSRGCSAGVLFCRPLSLVNVQGGARTEQRIAQCQRGGGGCCFGHLYLLSPQTAEGLYHAAVLLAHPLLSGGSGSSVHLSSRGSNEE